MNLKNGYGGRTIYATIKPISEPDIAARTTFMGINHLKQGKMVFNTKSCYQLDKIEAAVEGEKKKEKRKN